MKDPALFLNPLDIGHLTMITKMLGGLSIHYQIIQHTPPVSDIVASIQRLTLQWDIEPSTHPSHQTESTSDPSFPPHIQDITTGISCLSLQSDTDNPSNRPVALQSAYSQRRDLLRDDRTRKSAQVHKILDAVEIHMVPCREKLFAKPTNTGLVEIESELTCLRPMLEK